MLTLLSIAFVFVCVLLILLILIQRPKGGGLAGAFGGAGGSDQAMFGAKAGDALTWITVSLFVCFLLLAMGLTWTTQSAMKANDVPIYNLPVDDQDHSTHDHDQSTDATKQTQVNTADEKAPQTSSDTASDKPVNAVKDVTDQAAQVPQESEKVLQTQVKQATTPNDSEAQ